MKIRILTLLLAVLFSQLLFAQFSLQRQPVSIVNNINRTVTSWSSSSGGNMGKTSTCSYDTVNYVFNKTTQFQAINVNNVNSASICMQWYPAPQPITVSGFEFYAWQTAGTSAVVTLTCRIYNASLIDSLPTGPALATTTVNVDSTFGTGVLTTLRKIANFSTPVTVTGPYVITIETSSAINVGIITNNWLATPPNGRSEWLSSVRIGTANVRGYNVNIGTAQFNADFIMQPFVSFALTSNFVPSTLCNQGGNFISFTNTSSPVNFERFYNVRAFQNIPQFSFMWNYGDHIGIFYTVNGSRTYLANAQYTVTLTDTLIGWTRGCSDVKQVIINQSPNVPNAYSNSPLCLGGTLQLSCDTIPGASYIWTGPNGFTSSVQRPTVSNIGILNQGTYSVRAIAGQCTSAVASTVVNIISTPVASNNGPLCVGQQLALSVSNIAGATYSWTGPNGFSSNNINPTRTNISVNDAGTYNVSVTLAGCGTIGPFTTSVIVNPVPATPVASSNGPLCVGNNLQLSSTFISGATYSWSGPNGFTSTQQNPTRPSSTTAFAGTYTVEATVNGCTSASSSTTVTVNNIPTTPVLSSNSPLCVGQVLSLTSTPVSGATYEWSGPANFTSTQQNPTRDTVQLVHTGQYSLIATLNGCPSLPATINVVVSTSTPTPVASSNGPICPGQTLQLTASNILGATYNWTGPNGFSNSTQNPSISNVTVAADGLYSVTASTPGCSTSTAGTIQVQISSLPAAPAITSNSPLCDGATLQLNASNITGAIYNWSGPDGFTSNQQNPSIISVTASKAGQYSVFVTVSGCGTSNTSNHNVSIRRIPVPPSITSNAPVCTGDTIRFSATSSSTGPNRTFGWSGPNNFSSSLFNPILPNANQSNVGNYQATVSDSGCTSSPAIVSVSLRTPPQSPVAGNSGLVCEGSNIQLTASPVPGANYVWQGPDGFSSFSQNPFISGIGVAQAGTYSVRAIVNGCFSSPANTTVSITPLPETPVPSNNGPLCVGQALNLSTDFVQNATYSWTGPNGFSSTQRTPVISNTSIDASGMYEVVVIKQSCLSKPGNTLVEINPIPAAPGITTLPTNGILCTGDSLMLFAAFSTGADYEWTGPAGFGTGIQNPVIRNINIAQSGDYKVKMTKKGCTSPESTTSITVNPTPQTSSILGPDSVRNFETHTYTIQGDVGSIFNWVAVGGTQQSGGTTNTITIAWGASTNGIVRARETNTFGCRGELKQLNVNVRNTTSLSEAVMPAVAFYPNPASEKLTIQLSEKYNETINLHVFNILGQLVYQDQINGGAIEKTLNTTALTSGIYFVQLNSGSLTRTVKIEIQH